MVMRNLIYVIAFILFGIWGIGFFIYDIGDFIHLALIAAIILVIVRFVKGKKTRKLIAKAVKETTANFTTKIEEEVEDIEYETIGHMENLAPGFENFLEGKMVNNAISFKDKMNQRPNLPIDHKKIRK